VPDDTKPRFTQEEERLFAEQKRDMAELYPTPELWERSYPPVARPQDPALQQQYDDYAQMYPQEKQTKGEPTNMTREQQARVDQALSNVELSDKIGGANDAGAKPVPNDPTPLDKARDIGQDLSKAGVTMDKDK
jgi:hypothetical protein